MEENKYICPKCGAEMTAIYEKPALNLSCPKCGCEIATTKWDDIDLDDTDYEIILKAVESPTMDEIKIVSKMTGFNFIKSKSLMNNGGVLLKAKATEINANREILKKANIQFEIYPLFPY